MLRELVAEDTQESQVTSSSAFRASEAGECETFLCHLRLGHLSEGMSGRVRHMLDDGNMHERDIVSRLRSKGFRILHSYSDRQMLVRCYDKDGIIVVGHPDGILDSGGDPITLDYADNRFQWRSRFYCLEITAPNHFTFLRLQRDHMCETLFRKYVQIQLYLNSEEVRSYSDCCVVVVKNKNTSVLYEEGVSFDHVVIAETIEKLKRVEEFVSRNQTSPHRCVDWRRNYCRYRELCFGEPSDVTLGTSEGVLAGESLCEAEQLREAAEVWRRGKTLRLEGEELVEESRGYFSEIIRQYGCRGLTIEGVKALSVDEGTNRRVDYALLRGSYPEVYDRVVTESRRDSYVRVG